MIKNANNNIKQIKHNNHNIIKVIKNNLTIWEYLNTGIRFTGDPNTSYKFNSQSFTTDSEGVYFYKIDEMPNTQGSYGSGPFWGQKYSKIELVNIKDICSNLTYMYHYFGNNNKLVYIDLGDIDTSNVTNMNGWFWGCPNLIEIKGINNIDTGKSTVFSSMFEGLPISYLDLSNWNTNSVTRTDYMFNNCANLISLDISNFDISNVTYMYNMFGGCSQLIQIKCTQLTYNKFVENRVWPSGCQHILSD